MKYKKILLILAITTLSLTACKKEENPAPVETTALEETTIEETATDSKIDGNMDTITNADRGAAQGEVIETPTSETETSTETDGAIYFEEGEYVEPSMQENTNISEYDARMEKFKADMKYLYEAGLLTEEEYLDLIKDEPAPEVTQTKPESSLSAAEEALIKQYEENAAKAREEMSTNGQGDQRTDINYDIELPEHLKGR